MKTYSELNDLLKKFLSYKNYIFWGFLFIYSVVSIFLCGKLVIWGDESYTLYTTSNPLSNVINLSYHFEEQPPLYFIILAVWRKLNDGILFARILSFVFTMLSVYTLHKIGRLIFKQLYSRWILVIFLLNPYTLWSSTEIRLYSFLIFLSLITIYLFYLAFYYNNSKLKLLFVVAGVFGVYTQYYFVLLIISLSLLILVSKGWKSFLNFCLWSSLIALFFLPNFIYIGNQFDRVQGTQIGYSWQNWVSCIFYSPVQFIFAVYTLKLGLIQKWGILFFFALLVITSVFKLNDNYKKKKNNDYLTIRELLIPVTFLLICFTIVFIISNNSYNHRYLTIIYPFYCILFSTFGTFTKKLRTFIFIIFCSYYLILLINVYHYPYLKGHDVKSAAKYIKRIECKNEPVLFRSKTICLMFRPYYGVGINSVVSLPQSIYFNYHQKELADTIELDQIIKNKTKHCESFFFINGEDFNFVLKKELSNIDMDHYLKHNYIVTMDTIINGNTKLEFLRVRRFIKAQ